MLRHEVYGLHSWRYDLGPGARLVSRRSVSTAPSGYADWLIEIKARVIAARQRAVLATNLELTRLYWQIGRDILDRQVSQGWGAKVIERLANDLHDAFPEMRGFC